MSASIANGGCCCATCSLCLASTPRRGTRPFDCAVRRSCSSSPDPEGPGERWMSRFAGKIIFVAGSSAGIGRTTALRFAAEGGTVVFCSRRTEFLANIEAEIAAAGGKGEAMTVDIGDHQAYVAALEATRAKHGRLDILVHNAAYMRPGDLAETEYKIWQRHFRLNTDACFHANSTAVRMMREQGGGAIVNIASIATARSVPHHGAYGAAKSAMVQMSKYLAVENAKHGVRVNVLAPGMIATESLKWSFNHDEEAYAAVASRIPMERFGTTDEMASAILFFASDEASYITGQYLLVDGGKGEQLIV
ncbi:MAG: SDR family oxidoreductase [Sphingomonadales bacterium]|nr:MAG: SDR family oxidoreductase [Sphingomonadales bacterium]